MSKEMYLAIVEELMDDEGLTYDEASDRAYGEMRERLADMADSYRAREKDKQL